MRQLFLKFIQPLLSFGSIGAKHLQFSHLMKVIEDQGGVEAPHPHGGQPQGVLCGQGQTRFQGNHGLETHIACAAHTDGKSFPWPRQIRPCVRFAEQLSDGSDGADGCQAPQGLDPAHSRRLQAHFALPFQQHETVTRRPLPQIAGFQQKAGTGGLQGQKG